MKTKTTACKSYMTLLQIKQANKYSLSTTTVDKHTQI